MAVRSPATIGRDADPRRRGSRRGHDRWARLGPDPARGIPLAATNDIHYTERDHARPHDVLLCIQQQKVLTDTNRLKFDTDEFFLKSSAEMRKVFWRTGCFGPHRPRHGIGSLKSGSSISTG